MGEQKSDILLPESLMTTEYIEWSRRERDALIAEFNDQNDPAGEVARAVFAATWPQIENTLVWVDGVAEARKQFILAVQRFVDGAVGIYKLTEKVTATA